MKSVFFSCSVLILFISCTIKENVNTEHDDKLFHYVNKDSIKSTEIYCDFVNKSGLYYVEMNRKGQEFLVRGDSLDYVKDNMDLIILNLNNKFKVKVKKIKVKKDTIYVKIINNTLFTQEIGDTDANWYLASLVYSLTEGSFIKFVNIGFSPGDHGGLPGIKSRNDFKNQYYLCNQK